MIRILYENRKLNTDAPSNCYDSYIKCTLHCNPAWCTITQHNPGVRADPALVIIIFPNIASNQANCWGTTRGDGSGGYSLRKKKKKHGYNGAVYIFLQIVRSSYLNDSDPERRPWLQDPRCRCKCKCSITSTGIFNVWFSFKARSKSSQVKSPKENEQMVTLPAIVQRPWS